MTQADKAILISLIDSDIERLNTQADAIDDFNRQISYWKAAENMNLLKGRIESGEIS